jgi:excisionase family DNA binding protein
VTAPSAQRRAELVADGLITVKEAAKFLRLSRGKVYQLMDSGMLCYLKLGRARRIPRRAVVQLAARELRGGTLMIDGNQGN